MKILYCSQSLGSNKSMYNLSGAVLSTPITTDGGVHPCSKISNISINSILSFKTTTIAKADISNQNMFSANFYCERSTAVTLRCITSDNSLCVRSCLPGNHPC